MRLSTSCSGPIGKKLCLGLVLCLLTSPAFAVLGLKPKSPAQPLSPVSGVSPPMLSPEEKQNNAPGTPNASGPVPGSGPAARPEASPSAQALVPSTEPPPLEDPLQMLAAKQIVSPKLMAQTTPVTRAQLAEIMVKALDHGTDLTSEFPVYRDVSLAHPAYAYIEVARAKKLLDYPHDHGFYHPEQEIRFEELYVAISHAITGPPPQSQRAEYLLRNIPGHDAFSPELRDAVAKMAQSRFFTRTRRYQTVFSPPENWVTVPTLAPLIHYMMFLNQRRAPLLGISEVLPQVPPGLKLVISPATGILEDGLKAGGRLRFQLVEAVEGIPRTSTLFGSVEKTLPERTYLILINNIRTPDGQVYQTRAELSVSFSARDKLGFIVPGETFEVVTEPVPPTVTGMPSPTGMPDASVTPTTPTFPANPGTLRQPIRRLPKRL
ncbi:hypothetical protein [Vampirovibrio chlorellavorus]|uniref:hypothetical protein n=1 Tax=Vampirovibrio chlorellavorus TaxID=758823 RepID=UPI0026F28E1F|nr:hypothetical protein [Vampirovibrio chlorellavorus]